MNRQLGMMLRYVLVIGLAVLPTLILFSGKEDKTKRQSDDLPTSGLFTFENFVVDEETGMTSHDMMTHGRDLYRHGIVTSWAQPVHQDDFVKIGEELSKTDPDAFLDFSKSNIVVYNRVPKTGSSSITTLIKKMAAKNGFHVDHLKQDGRWTWRSLNREEEASVWCHRLSRKNNSFYHGHIFFTDSENLKGCCHVKDTKESKPLWINLVRDPVDMHHSKFYFIREIESWEVFPTKQHPSKIRYLDKDMSTCIMSGDLECEFRPGLAPNRDTTITYFCGNAPECKIVGHAGALQQAKKNIEKHYAVVGLLQKLPKFFQVLEHVIPKFFSGASSALLNLSSKFFRASYRLLYNFILPAAAYLSTEKIMSYDQNQCAGEHFDQTFDTGSMCFTNGHDRLDYIIRTLRENLEGDQANKALKEDSSTKQKRAQDYSFMEYDSQDFSSGSEREDWWRPRTKRERRAHKRRRERLQRRRERRKRFQGCLGTSYKHHPKLQEEAQLLQCKVKLSRKDYNIAELVRQSNIGYIIV